MALTCSRALAGLLAVLPGLHVPAAPLEDWLPGRRAPFPLGEVQTLEGWITHVDPARARLALQDDSAGLLLRCASPEFLGALTTGVWVRVEGLLRPAGDPPELSAPRLLATPRPTPPPVPLRAIPLGLGELLAGRAVGRWVEVEGEVRRIHAVTEAGASGWAITLARPEGRIAVHVPETRDTPPPWQVGDRLRVRAVHAASRRSDGRLLEPRLLAQGRQDLQVLRAGEPDLFALPLTRLDEAQWITEDHPPGAALRVRGTVTLSAPDHGVWIEGEGSALLLTPVSGEALPAVGQAIEAVGFLGRAGVNTRLEDARWRPLDPAPAPVAALRVEAGPRVAADWADRLISVPGVVEAGHAEAAGLRWRLRWGDQAWTALWPGSRAVDRPPGVEAGAQVRLTGVCRAENDGGWTLLLRGEEDVRVEMPAPFWTSSRLGRFALGTAAASLAALIWAVTLRGQVARRSRALALAERERRDREVEFAAVLAERKRLAADLHDSLAQGLTGVSLQLQAAEMARQARQPEQVDHLGLAARLLDQARTELRRSVWDLRSETLDLHDLPGALRGLAAREGLGEALTVEVDVEGEARPLPDLVANHLLRLAQEALHNAVRHGGARRVKIRLGFQPARLRLGVEDDGRGFDPGAAPGPAEGHFGLATLRERATRLGGILDLRSAPGRGTRVEVDVPLPPGVSPTA
jgi:signal transduction histidine kinase